MRKLAFVFATALAVAAPTIASAQGFSVHVGDDGYRGGGDYRGFRGEYQDHDRGWHRGWDHHHYRHGERVTIIKRHRHHDWDD